MYFKHIDQDIRESDIPKAICCWNNLDEKQRCIRDEQYSF